VQINDEGAALGAALQAAWVHEQGPVTKASLQSLVDQVLETDLSRSCDPNPQHVPIYAECYERYQTHLGAVMALYQ